MTMTDQPRTEPHGTPRTAQARGRIHIETIIRRADGTIREHLIEDEEVI